MSAILPLVSDRSLTPASAPAPALRWWREPLLHFLLLGGLLFAIDFAISGRSGDQHVIAVDADVDKQARDVFKAARNREPDADELYALRRVWLDNEVLYREGLALQVDKGDTMIRDRVIFKALSVVDASLKLPPIQDDTLRAWFEKNRQKYDTPARYDFHEAVLAGNATESARQELAAALRAGVPGDNKADLRIFKGRPRANLVQSYGPDFTASLDALPVGEWRAIQSRDDLRVIRLEARTGPAAVRFEDLRGVVLQDWTDAIMAEKRTAAVRALAKKYTVKVVESTGK